MTDEAQRKEEDREVGATALFVLGFILPLLGLAWGPGEWWQYLIWMGIGMILLHAHERWA
jgi:hypothetical protein